MNNSPAEILATYLWGMGIGTQPTANGAWPVYNGTMPEVGPGVPDNAVAVYNTSGRTDGRVQKSGETVVHPGIQIRVRGVDDPTAFNKVQELCNALDGIKQAAVTPSGGATTIVAATRMGTPLGLGREQGHQRFLYTINAVLTLPATTPIASI